MRTLLVFTCLAIATGAVVVRYADHVLPGRSTPRTVAASPAKEAPPVASARSVTLQGDGRNHFQVDARVDGRSVDFLVDTGASMIALRKSVAARLGFFPSPGEFTVKTQTANGTGTAARIQLKKVEISGITVRDVEAFVVPDEALTTNLLGMSFLSRVKWTHDKGRLILEQ